MIKHASQAVQTFYDLYNERENIAYWFGAKGQVLTYDLMRRLVAEEPEHFRRYSPQELERLMAWSSGKWGFDCSGLIGYCFGLEGWSSWGLWDYCDNKGPVKQALAGSILWKPGHVGLDVGFGEVGQICREGETIRLDDNGTQGFEAGGRIRGVDYANMYNF